MATIDYKEKYEKAVQAAMLAKQDTESAVTIRILEEIFPELKESGDEKIRKSLAAYFAKFKQSDMWDADFSFGDIVSWFEKQGEHANFRNKIQIGDKVTRNEDGVLVNLSQLNRVAKKDEKQGEQKKTPIEGEFPVQPKQEWSEEMGKLCLDAISLLRDYASGVDKNSQLGKKIGRADAFLSDLYHNAFYPSAHNMRENLRKSEWSEEDEYNYGIIQYILNNECVGKTDKENEINWFKSLKERYTWKPSDEQIGALNYYLKYHVDSDGVFGRQLVKLYQDLLKLREG